jgi:predicted dehydrogenase
MTFRSWTTGEPENIAYLTLFFSDTLIAHIHVNWLAPVKIRRTLLAGSKQMIVYDDIEPSEKIKVYDKGITLSPKGRSGEAVNTMKVGYRTGDMMAPQLDMTEALERELREFITCIATGARPTADGRAGLRMVRLLDAASRSLAQRGAIIQIEQEKVFA